MVHVLRFAPAPIVCAFDAAALVLHETNALLHVHVPGHGVVAPRVTGLDARLARGHVTEPMIVPVAADARGAGPPAVDGKRVVARRARVALLVGVAVLPV